MAIMRIFVFTNPLNSCSMKIKNTLLMFLASGLCLSCSAQLDVRIDGSRTPVNKTYNDLTDFNALHVSHAFEVDLIPSDRESVQLMVPPEAENYLVVKKEGNTLYIGMRDGYSFRFVNTKDDHCMKAIVYFKELNGVRCSGASEVDIKGLYDAQNQNLEISLSGASSFDGNVTNVNKVKAVLSGASELDMKGNGNDMELTCSGASEAEMDKFQVKNFSGSVSGASKAELYVTENFSGSASGASKMKVKGNPRVIKADKSGASSIIFE